MTRNGASELHPASITRLGHVGLVVTDLERYATFLTDGIGMFEVDRGEGTARFALDLRHHQVRLTQGAAPGCDGVGFDVVDLASLEALRARVVAAGLRILRDTPVDDAAEHGFSFQVPHGPVVELCVGVHQSPRVAGDKYDVYRVRRDAPVKIRKLGHVTIGTPDAAAVEQVFVDVLRFRISDRFPGVLAWARCNRDHHSVGFASAEAPGLHHIAFEIESFAHIEQLADRFARRGHRLVWGPGRHGPGNNLFVYLEDPDGNLVEIFCDLIQIEDERGYVPLEWDDLQEVGNSWGPLPDEAWFKKLTPFVAAVGAH
jgi:catechol-2,3-dioxygenase